MLAHPSAICRASKRRMNMSSDDLCTSSLPARTTHGTPSVAPFGPIASTVNTLPRSIQRALR
jgi:hypothetical protein